MLPQVAVRCGVAVRIGICQDNWSAKGSGNVSNTNGGWCLCLDGSLCHSGYHSNVNYNTLATLPAALLSAIMQPVAAQSPDLSLRMSNYCQANAGWH